MPGQGIFTPGPIFHYVSFRNTVGTYFFLGTSVTAPKPGWEKFEIPVMNDLGGRSARFQSIQDGAEGKITTTLNRFDLNLCRTIQALGNGTPTANPLVGPSPLTVLGSETGFARGTLVLGVSDFELVLVNGYAGTVAAGQPAAAAVDLQTARTYTSCSCMAYDESTEGTRVLEVAMAIAARNLYYTSTRGFRLFIEALGAVAVPAPT